MREREGEKKREGEREEGRERERTWLGQCVSIWPRYVRAGGWGPGVDQSEGYSSLFLSLALSFSLWKLTLALLVPFRPTFLRLTNVDAYVRTRTQYTPPRKLTHVTRLVYLLDYVG